MKKPQGKTDAAVGEPAGSGLDLSVVSALAKIAAQHDLSEVEIEHGGLRVRVGRERRTLVQPTAVIAPLAAAPAAVAVAPEKDHPGLVKSPMVGTAYLRANPEAKPFVEVGTLVKAGDKLLLVEAMKTFNEIVAPRAGKIAEIFIEDASPVEYGQALLVIE